MTGKLDEALRYQREGYHIIPIRKNKKPFVKWAGIRAKQPNYKAYDKIRKWWDDFGDFNIGIVTGEASGLIVVDADSEKGRNALNEFLPETLITPTAKTPKGWHYYFEYQEGINTGTRLITDCDIRSNGGYIIAPPSVTDYQENGNRQGGEYQWLDGLSIFEVPLAPLPELLADILKNAGAGYASAIMREHIKKDASLYKKECTSKSLKSPKNDGVTSNRLQPTSGDFKLGSRDNNLFHVANCLIKGGMETETACKVLKILALQCEPPFSEKEAERKIQSALQRKDRKDRNLAKEVRDFVATSSGWFLTSDGFNRLQVTSRQDKKAVVLELLRLKEKGIIERHGNRDGCYRRIESDCQPVNWQDASTDTVKLWLPFDIDKMAMIPPGSIISIAGEPNSGKTAVCMNSARYNFENWDVHYFSSEMGPGAFKRRVALFPDVLIKNFKVKFYPKSENFADVIKPGEGNLNIIDYLEIHKDFYLVAGHLKSIYDKLDGAVAIVALQKSPGQDLGRGGSFSIEKPVLSLSLSSGVATIAKLKEWAGDFNPNKMQYHFKLVDGCRFIKKQGWHRPIV